MNELAFVLRDPGMRNVIRNDFDDDQIGQLVLRWIVTSSCQLYQSIPSNYLWRSGVLS